MLNNMNFFVRKFFTSSMFFLPDIILSTGIVDEKDFFRNPIFYLTFFSFEGPLIKIFDLIIIDWFPMLLECVSMQSFRT